MKKKHLFILVITLAFLAPVAVLSVVAIAEGGISKNLPARPEGPCDIYAADGYANAAAQDAFCAHAWYAQPLC